MQAELISARDKTCSEIHKPIHRIATAVEGLYQSPYLQKWYRTDCDDYKGMSAVQLHT
jgi:hypothetical protein